MRERKVGEKGGRKRKGDKHMGEEREKQFSARIREQLMDGGIKYSSAY